MSKAITTRRGDRSLLHSKLKPKYQAFVNAYLTNGYRADKAALAVAKCDKDQAHRVGWRILHRDDVQREIQRQFVGHDLRRDRLLSELADMVYHANMVDFEPLITGEKTVEELADMGVDTRQIKSYQRSRDKEGKPVVKIELYDRQRAIEQALRVLGMYNGEAETSGGQATQVVQVVINSEAQKLAAGGEIPSPCPGVAVPAVFDAPAIEAVPSDGEDTGDSA